MADRPTGTVTFLFSDIEGSTRLWEQFPEAMQAALTRHDEILQRTIESHDGYVFKTVGDEFCAAFPSAQDAIAASLAIQWTLQSEDWGELGGLNVRMGIHTGEVEERDGDYFGPALNRVARLMAAGHGGQVLLSGATEAFVRDGLPSDADTADLGTHYLKDLDDPERIHQLCHPELPEAFPELKTLDRLPSNLPRSRSSFIGRAQAMAQIREELADSPVVTLTGMGGAGKTRLALEIAWELGPSYEDGLGWVELAPLTDPATVPEAVAWAVGVREEPGRPLTETLADALRSRRMLLVLDNCEHLIDACAELASAVIQVSSDLRVLTTSREVLRVPGEAVWEVPPLANPESDDTSDPTDLGKGEAVRLFVERARASDPEFALSADNAAAVARICQQLEGLPLALELAAARVRTMPAQEIADRLADRFRLLATRGRGMPSRHRTLEEALDWSWDLLSETERALLRRLTVFRGGFSLEAAEAIAADEAVPEADVLDLLADLVDKSLVVADKQRGQARYRLLETVRKYGEAKLESAGEMEPVRDRHLAFFLDLAEEAESELHGEHQATWLKQLGDEHDNLRAALGWALQADKAGDALRLSGALGPFWMAHGYFMEGRSWLQQAVCNREDAPPEAQVKALHHLGMLAREQGAYDEAGERLAESLTIARERHDQRRAASILAELGIVERAQGNLESAGQLSEEGYEIAREIGHQHGMAHNLHNMGILKEYQGKIDQSHHLIEKSRDIFYNMGDRQSIAQCIHEIGILEWSRGHLEASRQLVDQSYHIFREVGNKRGIAQALGMLGMVEHVQRNLEESCQLHERSLAIFREVGDKKNEAMTLNNLGLVKRDEGDLDMCRTLIEESLDIFQYIGNSKCLSMCLNNLGHTSIEQKEPQVARERFEASLAIRGNQANKPGIIDSLAGLASVLSAEGAYTQAAKLQGAVSATLDQLGAVLEDLEQDRYDRTATTLQEMLGDKECQQAFAAGQALSLAEAVELAVGPDSGVDLDLDS